MGWGGARPGNGRKSKAEEIKLIERLKPLEDKAFKALEKGLEKGDYAFVKLFYEYYAGKPTEHIKTDNVTEITIKLDDSIRNLITPAS